MEYVTAILYHKILDSDFTNMYQTQKPKKGNGQTYIQAACCGREALEEFFKDADKIEETEKFWDEEEKFPRMKYFINAYAIGSDKCSVLEFAPRTGERKDYRIARQNIENRHPAWKPKNGFPEPTKEEKHYVKEKNYPGIIDYLHIMIIKTLDENRVSKYYAAYVNSQYIPDSWPHGIGLEQIFLVSKKTSNILFLSDHYLRFENNKRCPFRYGSAIDKDINVASLPDDLYATPTDPVEYAKKKIAINLNPQIVSIEKVDAPKLKQPTKFSGKKVAYKNINTIKAYKNKKAIGDVGEELAMQVEKDRLTSEGRIDLADKVDWVSKTKGDGLGYDIKSFENRNGEYIDKFIEVKTTTAGINKPFDISQNEIDVSKEIGSQYYIYRFFGVANDAQNIKYYEVNGPVKQNFELIPTSYQAFRK